VDQRASGDGPTRTSGDVRRGACRSALPRERFSPLALNDEKRCPLQCRQLEDAGDTRDSRDVVDKIETEFFVERCVARIRRRGEE
jgi:hypothetical protein